MHKYDCKMHRKAFKMHISHLFLPVGQQIFQKSLKIEHVTGTSKCQNFQFAQFLCTYALTAIIKWVNFKLKKFSRKTNQPTKFTTQTQDS